MFKLFIFLLVTLCHTLSAAYSAKNYDHLLGMPGFNDELLQTHFKLYEGYVKNTNDLLVQLDQLPPSYEKGALRRRLGWEFDGMRLHELYFENLGGKGILNQKDSLSIAFVKQFGSFEKWKEDFIATGMIRGIGWALLYYDSEQKRLFNIWVNEHDTGHLATGTPILIMDVFEHAYMLQYKLDRAKYIDAFFSNINWEVVSRRFIP